MKQRQIEIFHILMNNQAAEISMILDLYGYLGGLYFMT